jgi:hypothetical protein
MVGQDPVYIFKLSFPADAPSINPFTHPPPSFRSVVFPFTLGLSLVPPSFSGLASHLYSFAGLILTVTICSSRSIGRRFHKDNLRPLSRFPDLFVTLRILSGSEW